MVSQSFFSSSRSALIYPAFDPIGKELQRWRTFQVKNSKPGINLQGMNTLKVSGSEQFSEKTFAELVHNIPVSPQKLIVLDLRQESHGFINGEPVYWFDGNYNYANRQKSLSEIERDECQRLNLAAKSKKIMINHSSQVTVKSAKTERDVVEGRGSTYIRLPVTDHNPPTNQTIDQFITLINTLPNDCWLHFHCKGGKGRTSTFLTLCDIIKNAPRVSLEDILARQNLIGGYDLKDIKRGRDCVERERAYKERFEFVQKFYLYCREVPNFQISWSEWIEKEHSIALNL